MRYSTVILLVFALAVCSWAAPAEQDVWTGIERVVAVGDIHGDYDALVELLRSADLVDRRGNWTGGSAHLVQTGDILDRGPHSRRVMDLLMKLEEQARRSGGRVHALLGNHEAMNVYGDLRYVSPGEFAAFRDADSDLRRDAFYQQHVEELKKAPPPGGLPRFDSAYRKEWLAKTPLGFAEHRINFGPEGTYGKWLRSKNTVVKINDTIYLHGGISPRYATHSVHEINERIRSELQDFSRLKNGFAIDPEGPLWYRGLVQAREEEIREHVDKVLAFHNARRIVIGHTVTDGAVMPRLGGKIIAIETGIAEFFGGRRACLVLEGGQPYALHRGRKLPLPSDAGPGLLAYLRDAAALDPPPSPLRRRIAELESLPRR